MMTSPTIDGENETKTNSSLSNCWQARDAWWKCLDLYDNCQPKCQKQIEQLHLACSPKMVGNFY